VSATVVAVAGGSKLLLDAIEVTARAAVVGVAGSL
jgi:hypothetical protein